MARTDADQAAALTRNQRAVLTALGDGPASMDWLTAMTGHSWQGISATMGSFFRLGLATRYKGRKGEYKITARGRRVLAVPLPLREPGGPVRDSDGPTGWSGVARFLNQSFDWPAGRRIDRRQVEAWHKRRTLNRAGQAPPSPVRKVSHPVRSYPSVLFEPAAWAEWARPGVPGEHGYGWAIPSERAA